MPVAVSLKMLVDALASQSDQCTSYVNGKTGDIFPVTDDDEAAARSYDMDDLPDWQREAVPQIREVLESEDWLELPDQFEINSYEIMRRFCLSVEPPDRRDQLLDAIRGRGAFRRFKDSVHRLGIADEWYGFHDRQLAEIGIDWLNEQGIPYENDL